LRRVCGICGVWRRLRRRRCAASASAPRRCATSAPCGVLRRLRRVCGVCGVLRRLRRVRRVCGVGGVSAACLRRVCGVSVAFCGVLRRFAASAASAAAAPGAEETTAAAFLSHTHRTIVGSSSLTRPQASSLTPKRQALSRTCPLALRAILFLPQTPQLSAHLSLLLPRPPPASQRGGTTATSPAPSNPPRVLRRRRPCRGKERGAPIVWTRKRPPASPPALPPL
jgi:hypothetical protein